ncbi:hypothetical protein ONZ45_g16465 [Pleurotus djamor]|nr:hypothetical protein ONZ45_g16465 [Pleurotus djamor]
MSYLRSPNYVCQPHHYHAIVNAADAGMRQLHGSLQTTLRSMAVGLFTKHTLVADHPRTLAGVDVGPLVERGQRLFQDAMNRAFLRLVLDHEAESSDRYTMINHLFSTTHLRSRYGRLLETIVTVKRSEALVNHLDSLNTRNQSEVLENLYADVFMVSIARFEQQAFDGVAPWLSRLLDPLLGFVFTTNLDAYTNHSIGIQNTTRHHQPPPPVPMASPEDVPYPITTPGFHFPNPPTPAGLNVTYLWFQRLSITRAQPPPVSSFPSRISALKSYIAPTKKRDRLTSPESMDDCHRNRKKPKTNRNRRASTPADQIAGPSMLPQSKKQKSKSKTVTAPNISSQRVPQPQDSARSSMISSWIPDLGPPASTTVPHTSPILVNEEAYGPAPPPTSLSIRFAQPSSPTRADRNATPMEDAQGSPTSPWLFGSPTSSYAKTLSSSSSSWSVKSCIEKGKTKLVSSNSFRRLAALVPDKIVPSLSLKRQPRSQSSEYTPVAEVSPSQPTTSTAVFQQSSLEPKEPQISRKPLVSRQPSTVVKRSVSKVDLEAEKSVYSTALKKLKISKIKRDGDSPALP